MMCTRSSTMIVRPTLVIQKVRKCGFNILRHQKRSAGFGNLFGKRLGKCPLGI